MGNLIISQTSSLKWIPVDSQTVPQYESKHMDDYWLEDRINRWQNLPSNKRWAQPWRSDDVIPEQFFNNAGAITLQFIDCTKVVRKSVPMTAKQQSKTQPGYFRYDAQIALTGLSGTYWVIAVVGGYKLAVSEPIFVQDEQPETILLQAWDGTPRGYYENVIYADGFKSSVRLPGLLNFKDPASKDTVYEDQDMDQVMVYSKPYRTWELLLGGSEDSGVPDWFIDKVNRLFGLSELQLDGKYYVKNEGAKFESFDDRFFGTLKSWKIELRERINRSARWFDNSNANLNEELELMLNATSRGFADTSVPDTTLVTFFDTE